MKWHQGLGLGLTLCVATIVAKAEQDYVNSDALRQAGLVKYWQIRLPLDPDQRLQNVYLVDDQLYAASDDGFVYAVHAPTGTLRWIRQITRLGFEIWRPCHLGNRTVFTTPANIQVYNRQFGDGIRKREVDSPLGTGPVSGDNQIFVGGTDRRVYAFSGTDLLPNWKFLTEGPISSIPTIQGIYLYVASDDGAVYSATQADKRFNWKSKTFAPISANLVSTVDGVYVASRDNSLYQFDLFFGRARWRARFSGPLYEPPVVTDRYAFQYCPDDGLAAVRTGILDIEDRIAWKIPDGRTLLTVSEDSAFVLTRNERLRVVDLETGNVRQTIRIPGMVLGIPDVTDTFLLTASRDGRLFCARPADVPYVRRADVQAALTEQDAEGTVAQGIVDELLDTPAPTIELPPRPPVGGKSKVSKNFGRGGDDN